MFGEMLMDIVGLCLKGSLASGLRSQNAVLRVFAQNIHNSSVTVSKCSLYNIPGI